MITLQTPELVHRVERLARAVEMDETTLVETAVERYLDQFERDKIHAETIVFWEMYAELQAKYLGEYVALHDGLVVDHDPNVLQLEQRVVERFGDITLLIAPITAAPRRELHHISVKLEP